MRMVKALFEFLIIFFCTIICTFPNRVLAEKNSNINISLDERRILNSGWLADGEIIISGNVTVFTAHRGFILDFKSSILTDAQHITLVNRYNPREKLNLRVLGSDWQVDPENNLRLILWSRENNINFRLVSDGNQNISAGSFDGLVNVATFE
jgi:hypothetical protein